MAIHFSAIAERILERGLNPWKRPEGTARIPSDVTNEEARPPSGSPAEWLRALADATNQLDEFLSFGPFAFAIEITWHQVRDQRDQRDQRVVKEAHCQAVVFNGCTAEEVYLGENPRSSQYLRVDYEPWNLGTVVFPDPLPHAHSNLRGEPRFAVSQHPSTPHVDFLELVVRNYDRWSWNRWADEVWEKRVRPTIPSRWTQKGGDPRSAIRTAFAENEFRLLVDELAEPLGRWRQALIAEKKDMSPLAVERTLDFLGF